MFCWSGRRLISALILPPGSFSILKLSGFCAEPLALSLGRACAKPAVVVVDPTIDFGVEISDFLSF